jgi:hypothetical protein
MSGSAVNRGGVRFEFRPDVDNPNFAWRAAMRNHDGFGPSPEDALGGLIASVEAELVVAKAAAATLRLSESGGSR